MSELSPLPRNYSALLQSLKERIQQAQVRAALAVSRELLQLYWQVGRDLEAASQQRTWGSKVVERVAQDLQKAFPGVEGFSKRNLERMRAFFLAYPDEAQFAAQPVSLCRNCPGAITWRCCKNSKTQPCASGTPPKPLNTAGAGLCWRLRLKPACTGAKGQP